MKNFFLKIKNQKDQNLPFVIYSKPNSATLVAVLQNNDTLYEVSDYTEKGFVFASFDERKLILLPENESTVITSEFEEGSFQIPDLPEEKINLEHKAKYEELVSKGVAAIKEGEFKKVVLSRCETVALDDFDFIYTFQCLVQLYPTAFAYCFYHPTIGLWMGAPPEKLLRATDESFETMALAGTQKAGDVADVHWQQKEIDEQQYVTDFILKRLKEVTSEINVSAPYTFRAGSIFHIRTDITGKLNKETSIIEVVQTLHPTPAMCGLPKKKAKAFIFENENYNRSFYSGFLGELNCNFTSNKESTDLYVNLRNMAITTNSATLFMGCGITRESVPEKEWDESVNKSMTMKRVLSIKAKNLN